MAADQYGAPRARGRVATGPTQGAERAPAAPTADHVRSLSEATSVGDIMTREVACLAPEASVATATEVFLDRDITAAPVVDAGWLPLAVMSKTDLLRFWSQQPRSALRASLAQQRPSQRRAAVPSPAGVRERLGAPPRAAAPAKPAAAEEEATGPSASHRFQVADVTRPYVLSLHEEAPISVAAALMAYENVHRLPIVASNGEVVGVVSTLDIVRWLAQTAGMGPG